MKIKYPPGSTPLDLNEMAGLIPDLRTQGELNDWEYLGIRKARQWAKKSKKLKGELLTISGLYLLHKKMFVDVWQWAGEQRNSMKNVGVDLGQIGPQLKHLCGNVELWVKNGVYDLNESAIRFHHGLTRIHPFPNGNGRHARLAADLLLVYNGKDELPWGLKADGKYNRKKYIAALKKADRGIFDDLLGFCK